MTVTLLLLSPMFTKINNKQCMDYLASFIDMT